MEAIVMMVLAIVISAVGGIYFMIQDRKKAKKAKHLKAERV